MFQLKRDRNQLAKQIVDLAVTGKPAPRLVVNTDRQKGGLKGGPARAEKLSRDQRSAIAKKAALKRWAKERST